VASHIFISHSSKDQKVARTICTALENRGLTCWVYSRNIQPGQNFQEQIVRAIRAAKIMVLVFTANANSSNEIKKELAIASQNNLVVIPVRIEDVIPNEAFTYEFATRQWIDLFEDWEASIARLVELIANTSDDHPSGDQTKGGLGSAGDAAIPPVDKGIKTGPALVAAPASFMQQPASRWAIIFGAAVIAVAGVAYGVVASHWQPAAVSGTPGSATQSVPTAHATSPAPSQPVTQPQPTQPSLPTTSPPEDQRLAPANDARVVNPASGEWTGAAAQADATFGGSPYCTYNVSMQNLNLKVSIDDNGNINSALLTGTMVETTVGGCPFAPLGNKSHTYSGGGSVEGKIIALELNPAPTNMPHALASFRGQIINGRLNGTLTLHRINAAGNLAWTVQSAVR
jgi:hypothetical protein